MSEKQLWNPSSNLFDIMKNYDINSIKHSPNDHKTNNNHYNNNIQDHISISRYDDIQFQKILRNDRRTEEEARILYEKVKELKFFHKFYLENDFEKLEQDAIIYLCKKMKYEKHEPGTFIFKEGDPSNGKIYIVYSGCVLVIIKQELNVYVKENQQIRKKKNEKEKEKEKDIRKSPKLSSEIKSNPLMITELRSIVNLSSMFSRVCRKSIILEKPIIPNTTRKEHNQSAVNQCATISSVEQEESSESESDSNVDITHHIANLVKTQGVIKDRITTGDLFGEKALTADTLRNASILTNTQCEFLVLTAQDFRIVKDKFDKTKTLKKEFILKHFPDLKNVNSENIIDGYLYNLKEEVCVIDTFLTEEGKPGDTIYVLSEGQCEISKVIILKEEQMDEIIQPKPMKKNIVICQIQPGAFIGEEVLFDAKHNNGQSVYEYSVKVISSKATFLSIKKKVFLQRFPLKCTNSVKQIYNKKKMVHERILSDIIQGQFMNMLTNGDKYNLESTAMTSVASNNNISLTRPLSSNMRSSSMRPLSSMPSLCSTSKNKPNKMTSFLEYESTINPNKSKQFAKSQNELANTDPMILSLPTHMSDFDYIREKSKSGTIKFESSPPHASRLTKSIQNIPANTTTTTNTGAISSAVVSPKGDIDENILNLLELKKTHLTLNTRQSINCNQELGLWNVKTMIKPKNQKTEQGNIQKSQVKQKKFDDPKPIEPSNQVNQSTKPKVFKKFTNIKARRSHSDVSIILSSNIGLGLSSPSNLQSDQPKAVIQKSQTILVRKNSEHFTDQPQEKDKDKDKDKEGQGGGGGGIANKSKTTIRSRINQSQDIPNYFRNLQQNFACLGEKLQLHDEAYISNVGNFKISFGSAHERASRMGKVLDIMNGFLPPTIIKIPTYNVEKHFKKKIDKQKKHYETRYGYVNSKNIINTSISNHSPEPSPMANHSHFSPGASRTSIGCPDEISKAKTLDIKQYFVKVNKDRTNETCNIEELEIDTESTRRKTVQLHCGTMTDLPTPTIVTSIPFNNISYARTDFMTPDKILKWKHKRYLSLTSRNKDLFKNTEGTVQTRLSTAASGISVRSKPS